MEGWNALHANAGRYVEALAYYNGTAAERFANEKIRDLIHRTGKGYRFRFAAIPVDVMAKRVRIAGVRSDVEAANARLEEIRKANGADIHEPHVMKQCFTFGDAYVLVWPVESDEDQDQVDGDTEDAAAEEDMRAVGVELSYQSPVNCRVMYDSEDGRRARFAIRRWLVPSPLGEGENYWRAEVWYADRIEPWATTKGAEPGVAESWKQWVDPEDPEAWPLPHDFEEIPIKHARNVGLPYGHPAHEAAYGPQDAITKAITTQVVVGIEAWGWRERYRILEDTKILESGGGAINWGDSAQGTRRTIADQDDRTADIGRGAAMEHVYPGTKAVGEFTPPDVGDMVAPIEAWLRWMSVVTSTPLSELDPTVQLSGVSQEKADAPLRAKERDAKLYLEDFWREVYTLAARMSGMDDPGTISVTWAPPEVTMDADWWSTAQVRVGLGVPVAQILQEANYLPDQVEAWLDAQGEAMALAQRIGILKELGEAIQLLGVGVQLGTVDAATVSALIQRAAGQIAAEPADDPA
jgi:hypothetical protein